MYPASDTYDLVHEELGDVFENENLREDLLEYLPDQRWCQKNFYSMRPEEVLHVSWQRFSKQVKHYTRYMFFTERKNQQFREEGLIPPGQTLDSIGDVVSASGLIRRLAVGTCFYRVRIHEANKYCSNAASLATPRIKYAKYHNRMSPAGIPMFYGASEERTALAETPRKKGKGLVATIAQFETLSEFRVLDLASLPPVPSIFDKMRRHRRSGHLFLRAFAKDVSKPIVKDGMEHIEYVPTQIVTEYFRYKFRDAKGNRVRGIIYPSSVKAGGNCCVLFFTNQSCCNPGSEHLKPQKWLRLKKDSIKRVVLP